MKKLLILVLVFLIGIKGFSQAIEKWKITDVEKFMSAKNDEILVINFWATFCKPCVAEIPSFISIAEKYKNDKVHLLLVSLDLPSYYPDKIVNFAKKHNFNSHIVWLNETNADYFCPKIDSSWSGSIPSTLMLNTKTGARKFFEEELTAVQFENALKELTGR